MLEANPLGAEGFGVEHRWIRFVCLLCTRICVVWKPGSGQWCTGSGAFLLDWSFCGIGRVAFGPCRHGEPRVSMILYN